MTILKTSKKRQRLLLCRFIFWVLGIFLKLCIKIPLVLKDRITKNNSARVTEYADGSICFHHDNEDYEKQAGTFFNEKAKERKAHYEKIFKLIIGQDTEDVNAEVERRIKEIPQEVKISIPENELRRKIYYEVWDGSGIEGWWE